MKIESNFTIDDVMQFMDTYLVRERDLLADRLQRVSQRLAELGPRVKDGSSSGGGWNAHEILAHMAVVAKFYGVMFHRIGSGKMTDVPLVDAVNLRDVAGQQMAELPSEKIADLARADIDRTVQALRAIEPARLRRAARIDDGSAMTAEDVVRLPLVSHLETHLEDIERLLGSNC